MKKLLQIAGIVLVIACVFSLLYGLLNWHGYYHLLDGSADLYTSMHRRMILGFTVGVVLAAAAIVCFVLRSKM